MVANGETDPLVYSSPFIGKLHRQDRHRTKKKAYLAGIAIVQDIVNDDQIAEVNKTHDVRP